MKKRKGTILITVLLFLAAVGFVLSQLGDFRFKPPVRRDEQFDLQSLHGAPSALHVEGNRLIDADGQVVILRGVMVQDPDELDRRGYFHREWFEQVQSLGANVVRIPVHPERWYRDADYLWRYLRPAVRWAGELGMYVIIDLHYIGNISSGAGEHMPDIPVDAATLSRDFWQLTARYFKDTPHVLFEIFNEPAEISEAAWRPAAQELVDVIRAQGAVQPVIVSGLEWTSNLRMYLQQPIQDRNAVYAAHIYPQHSSRLWSVWFGDLAQQAPVIISEWGFMDENRLEGPDFLRGDAATYGRPLLDYLKQNGIGWVACWFDDAWLPPMRTADGQMTVFGQFVVDHLKP